MEYLTICVRWCTSPKAHINFVQSDSEIQLQNYYIAQFITSQVHHLTLICVKVNSRNTAKVKNQSLETITSLWMEPKNELVMYNFDEILDVRSLDHFGIDKYSVTHTPADFMLSFYEHVLNTIDLVRSSGWIQREARTMADNDTSFLLQCKHKPHSVSVLTNDQPPRLLKVTCNHPQTIYELLKKHGLSCSSVWTSQIHLSARAPCCALDDFQIAMIKVNSIPYTSDFGYFTKQQGLYHEMKYITVQPKNKVMRHKPYEVPNRPVWEQRSPGRSTVCSSCDDSDDDLVCENESIPMAIYYHRPTVCLKDMLEQDGRFVDSVECEGSSKDSGGCSIPDPRKDALVWSSVKTLGPGLDIVLRGTDENNSSEEEDTESDLPFSCPTCYGMANMYFDCGHLSCKTCISSWTGTQSENKCSTCRKVPAFTKPLLFNDFNFTYCVTCWEKQTWVTNCGHVTCPCHKGKCQVCGYQPLLELRRLFTS